MFDVALGIARAKFIARAAIRDLADVPLYVITPREGTVLTRDVLGPRDGMCIRHCDAMFRHELERTGEWRGPGVAIIVDDQSSELVSLGEFDQVKWMTGLLLHELTHCLDKPAEVAAPVEIEPAQAIAALTRVTLALKETTEGFGVSVNYRAHGPSFTRIACHVWHRAKQAGFPIAPHWLGFGASYPGLGGLLAPPERYIEALADELDEAKSLKLRSICGFEPPDAYLKLWQASGERLANSLTEELEHGTVAQ
jgi:hypothetical protein